MRLGYRAKVEFVYSPKPWRVVCQVCKAEREIPEDSTPEQLKGRIEVFGREHRACALPKGVKGARR